MLQEAAEVSAWFSLTFTLLCSFKAGITGQCLEVLSSDFRLQMRRWTQSPVSYFPMQRSVGPICCNLRAVSLSVYRFPEQLRLDPKIYEKESQIIPPEEPAVFT